MPPPLPIPNCAATQPLTCIDSGRLLKRLVGGAGVSQVMLGVDRLDMIKGIPQKLLAFEEFLEEHPEWRDKVLLVQIAVPSRTDVPEYQVSMHSSCVPEVCVWGGGGGRQMSLRPLLNFYHRTGCHSLHSLPAKTLVTAIWMRYNNFHQTHPLFGCLCDHHSCGQSALQDSKRLRHSHLLQLSNLSQLGRGLFTASV